MQVLINKITSLDWNHTKSDTQYLTHPIHRYSGKFIPQIAKQVIELLTNENDIVLDPYCGSGTTLLEASLSNRRSVGIDLNPLAVLISKVKTTPVNNSEISAFYAYLNKELTPYTKKPQMSLLTEKLNANKENKIKSDPRWSDVWYKKWFKENALFELIAIDTVINQSELETFKSIGLVALSDILRKSSNAHSSYPNVMFDKNKNKISSPISLFLARLDEIIKSVSLLEEALKNKPIPTIIHGNARAIQLENNLVDAIITHPPYIASIPYAEYGMLSLKWLGYDPKKIDCELTGGKRQSKNVVVEFKKGFGEMINESYRVLKKKGKMFMLLGDPVVKGKKIDLNEMATDLAKKAGFEIITITSRNGINRRANKMAHESLLFFNKP